MYKILVVLTALMLGGCSCEQPNYHCDTEAQEKAASWILECFRLSPTHRHNSCSWTAKEIFCKRLERK